MPKLKGHNATAKRFRVTKNGKIIRRRAGARHLLSTKSANRRRKLRRPGLVHPADAKRIRRIMSV